MYICANEHPRKNADAYSTPQCRAYPISLRLHLPSASGNAEITMCPLSSRCPRFPRTDEIEAETSSTRLTSFARSTTVQPRLAPGLHCIYHTVRTKRSAFTAESIPGGRTKQHCSITREREHRRHNAPVTFTQTREACHHPLNEYTEYT